MTEDFNFLFKIYKTLPHGGQAHKAQFSPVHFVKQTSSG